MIQQKIHIRVILQGKGLAVRQERIALIIRKGPRHNLIAAI